MNKVNITSLGIGNIESVKSYLEWLGKKSMYLDINEHIPAESTLLVAGVAALSNINVINLLRSRIINHINLGGRVIGICAGYQLFFEKSEESGGELYGGSILAGGVSRVFSDKKSNIGNYKIENSDGINFGHGYFCHTYGLPYVKDRFELAGYISLNGDKKITALFKEGNIMGIQFHPEKSKNFNHDLIRDFL
jgi:glutamine amidotransferase